MSDASTGQEEAVAEEQPVACSLNASELQVRLAEIAAAGAEALIASEAEGDRHLLRFRAGTETRRRLERIVAAEAECCSFLELELELSEAGSELVLAIAAPGDGQAVADELAAAFTGAA
jgi:hypothetical protein